MSRILRVFSKLFSKLLSRLLGSSSASSNSNNYADANAEANRITGTDTEIDAPITDETADSAMETDNVSTSMNSGSDSDVFMNDLPTGNNVQEPVNMTLHVNVHSHTDLAQPTCRELGSEPEENYHGDSLVFANEPPTIYYLECNQEYASRLVINVENHSERNNTANLTDISMEDSICVAFMCRSDTSTAASSGAPSYRCSDTPTSCAAPDASENTSVATLTNTIHTLTDTALNTTNNTSCLDLNSLKLQLLISRFPFQNFLVELRTHALKQTNKQRLTLREYTDLRRIARRQWFQLPNHIKLRYSQRAAREELRAIKGEMHMDEEHQSEKLMKYRKKTTEKEKVNKAEDQTKREDASADRGSENQDDQAKRNQEEDQEKNTNNVNHETETETENNNNLQMEDEKQENKAPEMEDNVSPMDVDDCKEPERPSTSSGCAKGKRKGSPLRGDEPVAKKRNRVAASSEANENPAPSQDSVNSPTDSRSPNSNGRPPQSGNDYTAWVKSPPEKTDKNK